MQRLPQQREISSVLWITTICLRRMHSLKLPSVWKKIRPSMLFIPMRTRYGPICPSISSRISNRISIWICCGQTIISAISSLYGGRLRRKPAAFVRNTMGRRIMIISSAARKWREKLYTFREFYITGGSTALPPRTIRQASCMRMRQVKKQLRETLRAAAKREPSHCVRIMVSMMWIINCGERLWFRF